MIIFSATWNFLHMLDAWLLAHVATPTGVTIMIGVVFLLVADVLAERVATRRHR